MEAPTVFANDDERRDKQDAFKQHIHKSSYGFVMGDDARSSSGYAFTSITKPQGTTWSSASGLHMVYENNTPIGSCTTNL